MQNSDSMRNMNSSQELREDEFMSLIGCLLPGLADNVNSISTTSVFIHICDAETEQIE